MARDDAGGAADPSRAPADDGDRPWWRARRTRLAVAVVIAAATLAVVVLASRDHGPDPHVALDAARAAVVESGSFRFEVRSTMSQDGEPIARRRAAGTVAATDRWRVEELVDGREQEAVEVGGVRYVRTPSHLDGDQPWLVEEPPEGMGPSAPPGLRVRLATLGDPAAPPTPGAVLRLLHEAQDPRLVPDDADEVALRATVPPPAALDTGGAALPVATVEIALGADDLPRSLRVRAAEDVLELRAEVTFADWGAAFEIEPPEEDEVDRTPWVDEQGLAAAPAGQLLVPAAVPDGLALRRARVLEPDGDDACPIVTLSWEPDEPRPADGGDPSPYLWVTTYPRACEGAAGLGVPGGFDLALGGLPARRGWAWEVVVDDVVVMLDSHADEDELARVAASLEPTAAAEVVDAVVPQA